MGRKVEITVGFFMLLVIFAVFFICFKVTDASTFTNKSSFRVQAIFDNVGGLKARSPIKIGGVVIGRISDITLSNEDYKPLVTIDIDTKYNRIPSSSALSIKTSGLLGEQFIDVSLGIEKSIENEIDALDALDFENNSFTTTSTTPDYFEDGFVIHNTKPAMVIEDLIGQFLYSSGENKDNAEQPAQK